MKTIFAVICVILWLASLGCMCVYATGILWSISTVLVVATFTIQGLASGFGTFLILAVIFGWPSAHVGN